MNLCKIPIQTFLHPRNFQGNFIEIILILFNCIFFHFQTISGETDIDQLSRYFSKQEDENFALFSYVNELSYEVEVLNETVQRFRDDIGEFMFIFLIVAVDHGVNLNRTRILHIGYYLTYGVQRTGPF